jgi:hypothetical protein
MSSNAQPPGVPPTSSPVTRRAPRAAPPGFCSPGVAGSYPWLCFTYGCLLMLSPEDAVVAEARAVVGDLTIAFCGGCATRWRADLSP